MLPKFNFFQLLFILIYKNKFLFYKNKYVGDSFKLKLHKATILISDMR